MIISKTPLRVSLFGGGTDYPEFVDKRRGVVIGGTINKFLYISGNELSKIAEENIRLSYRKVEACKNLDDLSHPIVREYLKLVGFNKKYAFHTVSDIPGSSGLGSSSAFSVGFIRLIDFIQGKLRSSANCAKLAIHLEREILREPVGLQDQYHAAFGGFGKYEFTRDSYSFSQCAWGPDDYAFMNSRVCLVHTGGFRDARKILVEQKNSNINLSKDDYLIKMVDLADDAFSILNRSISEADLKLIAELLNESWQLKKSLAKSISNQKIDEMINLGIENGAKGAKLLGAGSEGFIMFLGDEDCCRSMTKTFGMRSVVKFDFGPFSNSTISIG